MPESRLIIPVCMYIEICQIVAFITTSELPVGHNVMHMHHSTAQLRLRPHKSVMKRNAAC